jgi:4,5-DOPA dioxygenase extradiol
VRKINAQMNLKDLHQFSLRLEYTDRMPALFIGHGSPMNGIEKNIFSDNWKILGDKIQQPAAILCISAHWLTRGTFVTAMAQPRTIHDFGGFPDELYQVQYPAPGNPELAKEISEMVKYTNAGLDHEWGLDHGTWSVVRKMYPDAQIPVLQLSIDYFQPGDFHYRLAKNLAALRKKGVLIVGSGNMVHNLRMAAFDQINNYGYAYDWAKEMNALFKEKIMQNDHQPLINYESLNSASKLAIPTPDHYWPLLYILGLQQPEDETSIFNDELLAGSLSMTSVIFS